MPTYEYKREDGTIFEVTQSMNDEPLKTCPKTGQSVQRIISGGGGVVYKGTGWYVTDYKNGNSKQNGSATEKAEPEAQKQDGKKSSSETSKE